MGDGGMGSRLACSLSCLRVKRSEPTPPPPSPSKRRCPSSSHSPSERCTSSASETGEEVDACLGGPSAPVGPTGHTYLRW